MPTVAGGGPAHITRAAALAVGGTRVKIDTPDVDGSLLLKGARFDDLRLKKYHETSDTRSPEIVLLAPKGTDYPYFVDFGWTNAQGVSQPLPGDNTVWTLTGGTMLTPGHPITLTWDNGHGLVFTRRIEVDDQYMFTVTDGVANKGGAAATLYPYALVARDGVPPGQKYWVLHEGFVGWADSLKDAGYDDFKDEGTPPKTFSATGGWAGITDKYWMAARHPAAARELRRLVPRRHVRSHESLLRQLSARRPQHRRRGGVASVTHHLFAGAKVVDTLRHYEHTLGVADFVMAIDWGWFRPITQPLFWILDYFYKLLGNFGLAILLLTVCVKAVTFPIANASAKTHGQDEEGPARAGEDQGALPRRSGQAAAGDHGALSPREGESRHRLRAAAPGHSGVFSLYKVFFVTIEMRQGAVLWLGPRPRRAGSDLDHQPVRPSALLAAELHPGVPLHRHLADLMGITQWVQTKLNPAPADPVQARMFGLMPIMFTFMFATFPAGLVIYYTWNNILGVAQQWYIMRRQGVEVHLFKNLRLDAIVQRLTGGGGEKPPARERPVSDAAEDGERERAAAVKLFAGACDFVWGTGDAASLPPASLPEIAFVGPLQCRQVEPDQRADQPQNAGAGEPYAGAHAGDHFFKLADRLMLADLPGYGYAKASKAMTADWQRLIFAICAAAPACGAWCS